MRAHRCGATPNTRWMVLMIAGERDAAPTISTLDRSAAVMPAMSRARWQGPSTRERTDWASASKASRVISDRKSVSSMRHSTAMGAYTAKAASHGVLPSLDLFPASYTADVTLAPRAADATRLCT